MKKLFPLLFTVQMELLAFSMLLPILPFLIKEQGGSDFIVTSITGAFAFAAFLFAPLWGALSDKWGRKPLLILALLISAGNYLWMSFASYLWMILVARILSGIASGWMSVVQSWVADLVEPKKRTAALGLLGSSFGVGFALGPALGGFLATEKAQSFFLFQPILQILPNSHQLPIFVAGVLALIIGLLGLKILPNSNKFTMSANQTDESNRHLTSNKVSPSTNTTSVNMASAENANSIMANNNNTTAANNTSPIFMRVIKKLLLVIYSPFWRDPVISRYLLLVFMGQMAFSTLESIFAIWGQAQFQFTAADISFIFSFLGVLTILVQGGLIRPIVHVLKEKNTMRAGLILLIIGFLALTLLSPYVQFQQWVIAGHWQVWQDNIKNATGYGQAVTIFLLVLNSIKDLLLIILNYWGDCFQWGQNTLKLLIQNLHLANHGIGAVVTSSSDFIGLILGNIAEFLHDLALAWQEFSLLLWTMDVIDAITQAIPAKFWVYPIIAIIGIGICLFNPALQGSLSHLSPNNQRGAVLGLSQSLQSLARGVGAAFLGGLFTLLQGGIFILPLILFIMVFLLLQKLPAAHAKLDEANPNDTNQGGTQ